MQLCEQRALWALVSLESEANVPVQVDLRRIISGTNDALEQHFVILKEVEGERSFPIVVGPFEAMHIERRVRGLTSVRPLTHDLVIASIEALGGVIQDVIIHELREGTYFAYLRISKDGELIQVDCRPSDAMAIAVQTRVPIYCSEEVIQEAIGGNSFSL
jgi:bifunctional DNase/RNase